MPDIRLHRADDSSPFLEAAAGKTRFSTTGGFLFTHRGYSGPSVLNISHFAVQSRLRGGPRQQILVQWTADDVVAWDAALRQGGTVQLGTVLRRSLPARLADALMAEAGVEPHTPLSALKDPETDAARVKEGHSQYLVLIGASGGVSALTGALFLLLVDNLSRGATTMEIPLGITTSVIGAPLFLLLLLRARTGWS